MAGTDFMAFSSDNWAKIQTSVLCRFITYYGDLDVLKGFWSDVGVIVNHQSLFTDFDWSKDRLSVSNSTSLRHHCHNNTLVELKSHQLQSI